MKSLSKKKTNKTDERKRLFELVDKAYPFLMALSDICLTNMSGMTINVNGGHFEYVADRPQEITIKTDWEKEFELAFTTIGYIQDGHEYLRFKPNVTPKEVVKYIQDLFLHQRQEILDQVEKEVIGEDEPRSNTLTEKDFIVKFGSAAAGAFNDVVNDIAEKQNQLRAELRQKLSTLRKEER